MQNPIKKEIGCIGLVSFFILDDSEYANFDWQLLYKQSVANDKI